MEGPWEGGEEMASSVELTHMSTADHVKFRQVRGKGILKQGKRKINL